MTTRWLRTVVVVVCLASLSPTTASLQESGDGNAVEAGPLAAGTPLQGDQFPRFIRPSHVGLFGFDNFLVLGDYPTVQFERRDADQASGMAPETWSRVEVAELAGRVVSVFRPVWSTDELEAGFRSQRWGVDRPSLFWGEIVVPGAGDSGRRDVYLQLAPTNLPSSEVVRVNDTVQYASHAVNIWVPGFAESRVQSGDAALRLDEVSRRFYEVFVDEYETLAVVSQTALLASYTGFRENVKNEVSGIGLPLFDQTERYGSDGVLEGIEAYPPGGWATSEATLHQQAHQWGDFSAVWDQLGITRQGDDPAHHTPLLSPGAVLAGAVLEGTRRVASPSPGFFSIERTLPMIEFHPLSLYRMGLLGADELPEMRVFVDQGQFDPGGRSSPDAGTLVAGGTVPVFPNDLLVADGPRSGPDAAQVRRALIYVSRGGLASKEEMDVVNFYAARAEATHGVTSWDQYPSFFEATGGRARMTSDVAPLPGVTAEGKIEGGPVVEDLAVAPDALTGVLLDDAIPGRVSRGESLVLSGTVTADDRDDYGIVCFRFIRYGATDANEVFVCSSLVGNRFAVEVTFTDGQQGAYTVEPFLFWPGSSGQLARSRYGVVVVD